MIKIPMNQRDFDNVVKTLPDAGDYPYDVYLIPLLNIGCTLIFRKQEFILCCIKRFVRWELESVELI